MGNELNSRVVSPKSRADRFQNNVTVKRVCIKYEKHSNKNTVIQ